MDEWEGMEEYGIFLEDVAEIVTADDENGGTLWLLSGQFVWDDIRDGLEKARFRDSTYRNIEVWEDRRVDQFIALLEERGEIAISSPDDEGVRDLIRTLERGSGFLFDDADSEMRRALRSVRWGFNVIVEDRCGGMEVLGCRAVAYGARRGEEPFSTALEWAFLFRSQASARSAVEGVKEHFDNRMPQELDVGEVVQEGEFILVRAVMDEEDLALSEGAMRMTAR